VQEVEGSGVVGEQPQLLPGKPYQYTSGVALNTPSGIMRGNYELKNAEGNCFAIEIPIFSLDSIVQKLRPN
jgi:ApaG protein